MGRENYGVGTGGVDTLIAWRGSLITKTIADAYPTQSQFFNRGKVHAKALGIPHRTLMFTEHEALQAALIECCNQKRGL